jgi:hypothetical protein
MVLEPEFKTNDKAPKYTQHAGELIYVKVPGMRIAQPPTVYTCCQEGWY